MRRWPRVDVGYALVMSAIVSILWCLAIVAIATAPAPFAQVACSAFIPFCVVIARHYVSCLLAIHRYAQRNAVAPAVPDRAQHDGAVSLPSEGGEVSIAPSGEVSTWP